MNQRETKGKGREKKISSTEEKLEKVNGKGKLELKETIISPFRYSLCFSHSLSHTDRLALRLCFSLFSPFVSILM